ncbi:zinc finger, CCHC-type containing protein [Tanacetum coccineum]
MVAAMKHMASNFAKLEKFEGVDFRRWKKKMHFFLSSMSLVYVLTALMPEDGGENPTIDQVRKRAKWDNDDYVCRELWDTLEAKYMVKDASSKKFLDNDKPKGNNVAGPLVFNMVEHNNSSKYNDNKVKHKNHDTRANPNKTPKVTCLKCGKPGHLKKVCKAGNVGKRANGSSRKGFEDGYSNPLKGQSMFNKSYQIYYVTYVSEAFFMLPMYLRPSLCMMMMMRGNESTDLVYRRGCVDLRLNIISDNIGSAFMSTTKLNDSILWHARLGHVHFKRMQDMSKDGLILAIDKEIEKCLSQGFWSEAMTVVRLPDPKLKTLGERGIKCIFVGYAKHSKAFRFYVIEPNNSVAINSIIESRDAIFDEHRFSCVPRPSQRSLVKGTEDSGGSVVPEKVTNEIVQQSEPELRKSKRHRIPKYFGPEFQLYLIEGSSDEVFDQHSYCFNIEDDPKAFDEAMKFQDVSF